MWLTHGSNRQTKVARSQSRRIVSPQISRLPVAPNGPGQGKEQTIVSG